MKIKSIFYLPLFFLFLLSATFSVNAQTLESESPVEISPSDSVNNNERMMRQQNMPSNVASPSPSLRRKNLQNRINNISDERKKEAMARLDSRLAERNTRLVATMTNHLEKIEAILTRVESKIKELSTADVAILTSVATAKNYISSANMAVTDQSRKEYLIDFKDEESLRMSASETVKKLRDDITVTRDSVKTARDAVSDVVDAYEILVGLENQIGF